MVKTKHAPPTPNEWLAGITALRGPDDAQPLKKAIELYLNNDNELLNHGLQIAEVLLSLGMDSETLAAALLYPLFQTNQIHHDTVAETFGDRVNKILADAIQMQSLEKFKHANEQHQIENLRKVLLAMVTDIRAVIIILAERLVQLRQAKLIPDTAQRRLANQTIKIYAPLANRLGIWQLKWELEDLSLRYLAPEAYKSIASALANKRIEREKFIADAIEKLTSLLKQHRIPDFKVTGRIKHIYSIYNKMQRKGNNFEKIYDISAMRVLVPTIDDCYNVMGILHHTWHHIPEEFDDYISKPKPNGYQSIHTVVTSLENKPVEIQIRTYQMHNTSEVGIASHWSYKENIKSDTNYEEKIALLRQIMAWQNEISNDQPENGKMNVSNLFSDRVYVFTPLGDIIDLPSNATPLDFAYAIHSEIGHRCRGAKVNGKLVQLTSPLKTGDRIEIQTTKIAQPSRDWLNPHKNYIKTARARSHIQHWFRIHDPAEKMATLAEHSSKGKIKPKLPAARHDLATTTHAFNQSVSNYLTKFSRCCKPLPGDEVIGYITQKNGLSVHRIDCSNFLYLKSRNPNRVLEIRLNEKQEDAFPVDLEIRGTVSSKLINTITNTLANANIRIVAISEQTFKSADISAYLLTVSLRSMGELRHCQTLLQQIPDVIDVKRR